MMKISKGFSLLEMMIALSLALFLFAGVYEVFNSVRQSQRYVQGLALIQENGQLASYLFTKELTKAGFMGCRQLNTHFPLINHTSALAEPDLLIHGYSFQNLPADKQFLKQQMLPNSTTLMLQFMSTETASLLKSITTATTWLFIDNAALFKTGQKVLIADCLHADLFSVEAISKDQVLQSQTAVTDYSAGAQLGLWQEEWFYIASTGRLDELNQPITALYLHQPDGRDEELVDNVSNMHLQYGYLSEGQLHFVSATQVPDWSLIKAVKVKLLLNSGEAVLMSKQSVIFDGEPWLPPNLNLYRQWEFTVALPNR